MQTEQQQVTQQQAQTQQTEAAIEKQRTPLGFEPANVDDVWRMATMLAKADIIPDVLRGKPSDVLVTLLSGREMGLSAMQSLRMIYVVKGRPFIGAQLKIAMVKKSPECLYFRCVETTSQKATFETERKDEGKTSITFTIEDATRAGLAGRVSRSGEPDNWSKYPATMLRWRAASQLADLVYPDIIGGIGTTDEAEELEANERSREVRPPPAPPKAEKTVGSGTTSKASVVRAVPNPPTEAEQVQAAPEAKPESSPAPAGAPASNVPTDFELLLGDIEHSGSERDLDEYVMPRVAKLAKGTEERKLAGEAVNKKRAQLRGAA